MMGEDGRHRKLSRRRFLGLTGLAALTLSGCDVVRGGQRYQVNISRNHTFEPAVLIIPIGSTVTWHNQGVTLHTVTSDPSLARHQPHAVLPEGAQTFDSGRIYPGQFWSHTFDVTGSYIYFCRFFELRGMIGNIVVLSDEEYEEYIDND